jgi:uncharacterized membrane protein
VYNNRRTIHIYIVGSFYPEALSNGEEVWKGLSTIAGSWIGGGANQTAMLEVFGASKSMFADDCCRCTSCQFMDGVLLYDSKNQIKLTNG